jgi:HAD superfamily hydrolase (TIGR01549 family)
VTSHLDVVFFDVGGPIYGDRPYYAALLAAIEEVRPDADEERFWAEFQAARRDQRGPFTRRLSLLFVDEDQVASVVDRGRDLWHYEAEDLHSDVHGALEALHGGYRLGILANQQAWVRDVLARDGLARFFDIWTISEEVGAEKPDPAIFEHALRVAGSPPERCAMVGDRLDNDIVAARRHGMKGVWLLRGEAPDHPTDDQLAQADVSIRSLSELPEALRRL